MRALLLANLLLVFCANQAWAIDLSGRWEVQATGTDREVALLQKGAKLVAHRIMWPELEGERYKLEHLYRGTLTGSVIRGELFVREPELKDFAVLREFTGSVSSTGEVTIDGLLLKRLSAAATTMPEPPQSSTPRRPSEPPTVAQASPPAEPVHSLLSFVCLTTRITALVTAPKPTMSPVINP